MMQVIYEGARYIRIAALSFIPTMITMAMPVVAIVGDSERPLFAGIISMITNVFFNYMLIYGHFGAPALGVMVQGLVQ